MVVAADYMNKEVFALVPDDTLSTARNVLLNKKIGRLVVVDKNDRLVGILSRTDLALALRQNGPAWRRRPIDEILVGDAMKTQVTIAHLDTPLSKVAAAMLEGGIGGIPILQDEQIIGIIATHDLTRYISEKGNSTWKVREYLNKQVAVASLQHSINHVIRLMVLDPSRRVVILGVERLPIGIITPSNLAFTKFGAKKGSQGGRFTRGRTTILGLSQARDVMTSPVYVIHENDRVVEAAKIMVDHRVGGLPVLDSKPVLLGLFCKKEVLKIVATSMPD